MTDPFRRLVTTDEEAEAVPTENPTDVQATNFDQDTPTKTQGESWVYERVEWNFDTFIDFILV